MYQSHIYIHTYTCKYEVRSESPVINGEREGHIGINRLTSFSIEINNNKINIL